MVARLLRCPDDRGELNLEVDGARCATCQRLYPLRTPNVLEVMPSQPLAREIGDDRLARLSIEYYRRHFFDTWPEDITGRPWGHPDDMSPATQRRYATMYRIVEALAPTRGDAFLDISAGAATLSLPIVDRFDLPVLADLASSTAAWLGQRACSLVVRADYLQAPFAPGAFDFVLCTDTLIYGESHDRRLLATIWEVLRPGGTALVTFHNRRHHVPIKAPFVKSYSKGEAQALVASLAPPPAATFHKYHQEFPDDDRVWWKIGRAIVPPTRYFVELSKR